ncbi:MAG: Ig-like domain-containing protein [Actinobacteria bacterium]|nr:Ig-like domain-containing protein [Actinomycetota bacterium]
MEIRRSFLIKLRLLILAIALFLTLSLFPNAVSADQLLLNGNFKDDIKNWKPKDQSKGMEMVWDAAGYKDAGSALFKISGRRVQGEMSATQQAAVQVQAGSKGKVEFAWKKNWSAILPLGQRIYLELVKPDKTTVTIWADKTLLNNNIWTVSSVDVSSFLDQNGRYSIRLGAAFENGNAGEATTYAWFDNVRFDISAGLNSRPKTSLINPVGISKLVGERYPIGGIATDDVGIEKVEVAIIRLYDNTYWNGTSWVTNEFWNQADITSGKGDRMATWSYVWPLPTSDGASFKILARSVDIAENMESSPVENTVQVDNVGPTGNIYIEDTATHTNSEQVHVSIDIKGASKMRFSLDNGNSWTKWEKFAVAKMLMLPKGDGTKVISAQFRDDSRNNYRVSDSIVLDTVSPVTRHVFPATNAKKVSLNSSVSIVFYENMDPSSFKNDGTERGSTLYIKQGSRWVAAKVSYDERTKTAKLIPNNQLSAGTVYTVHLNGGLKDIAGNALASNLSWSFTTAGSYISSFKGTIGVAGGKLEDGNQAISLELPKGALSADTVITVEELRDKEVPQMIGLTRYSPVYRITPGRLPLSAPATLRIKYRLDEVPNQTDLRLIFYDDQQQKWLPVPNASIDLANNQVIASIAFLTTIAIVAEEDGSAPTTAIMAPTGMVGFASRAYNIYGLSTDNLGIASVELAISRQSDHAYWNGTDWQASEVWVKAKIIARKERSSATWSYRWILPEGGNTDYQIRARAIDSSGNIESSPNIVQIRLKED